MGSCGFYDGADFYDSANQCGLDIKVFLKEELSKSYLFRIVDQENSLSVNELFSSRAEVFYWGDSRKDIFMNGVDISSVELHKLVLHNDLVEFIKRYFPYLYNVILLPFTKSKYCIDDIDYDLHENVVALNRNLFWTLNNKDARALLEEFIAKKYGCDNVTVECNFTVGVMEAQSDYCDAWYEEVCYQSFNCKFPALTKRVDKSIFVAVGSEVSFDDLVMGYYLYKMGGVKNIAVRYTDNRNANSKPYLRLQIEADVYQMLQQQSSVAPDFKKVTVCPKSIPPGLEPYDEEEEEIPESEFISWVRNGETVAIYLAILNDKNLKQRFYDAKALWLSAAREWNAGIPIRRRQREETERLEGEQRDKAEQLEAQRKETEERKKKLAREQEEFQEKQKQEKIKVACQRVEKFFAAPQHDALYVKHNDYGAGVVETLTDSYGMKLLTVIFKGDTKKTFEYPKCFGATLTFINEDEYRSATPPPPKRGPYWNY